VLDFGIAKSSSMTLSGSSGEGPYTQTGALLGTPYYMSPEQATGDKSIDHRTDLWAMGVIAFECLVGRRPYQSDSLGDLVLQICSKAQPVPSKLGPHPPAFDAWFQRAQKRLPSERFQSAKELIRALRQALAVSARASLDVVDDSAGDDSPFHSGAEQPAETLDAFTATTQPRRRPWLFGVVAVVMLLAAAVGGWGLARSGDGSQATPGEVSSSELDGPPTAPEPAGQPSTEPSTEPSGEGTDLRAAGSAAASASASADVAAPAKPVPAAPRPRAPGPAPPRRPPPPPSDPLAI
jgi:serine/threonine-protein kinase